MANRGKFLSLTMVNWNGFFARTFDLDELVTTMSGGNGAGKSTTMAAFITALIPDQSLLHFRNTTEAGSASASRDKGLYGKLKKGLCYSLLEIRNSREQKIWVGTHLEQIAGRDNKVNITPFALCDVPEGVRPTDLLLEKLEDGKAKVCSFNDLRCAAAELDGVRVAKFNSITDYHNFMFDIGAIPKKLRDQKDRSKFYRLIEASLYGGISSTIARSLRDYLLPENSGIKKAFQDMESAIKENRHTLDMIRQTQVDRDMFKNLITETTNYVAAEYVRLSSRRDELSASALEQRQSLFSKQSILKQEQHRILFLSNELDNLANREVMLEQELEYAGETLQKILAAVSLKTKLDTYRVEIHKVTEQLEEQLAIVVEASAIHLEAETGKEQTEAEVDSLKTQLSDYQQALDSQQTRAIQYNQALKALSGARQLCELPDLVAESAAGQLVEFRQTESSATQHVLRIKQDLQLAQAALAEFEQGLSLLIAIEGDCPRDEAYKLASQTLAKGREYKAVEARKEQVTQGERDAQQNLNNQQKAEKLAAELEQVSASRVASELDVEQQEEIQLEGEQLKQEALTEAGELVVVVKQKQLSISSENERLKTFAPKWIVANEERDRLSASVDVTLSDADSLSNAMQQTLSQEQVLKSRKAELEEQKKAIEKQVRQLQTAGGEGDERLNSVAHTLGGTLLSDVYDDIPLEDAAYYSALYGPARYAVVVQDIEAAKQKLTELDECPDDLYLIQGNPDAFDEELLNAQQLDGAVLVKEGNRQLRYSPLPTTPLFGRAAREARIAQLEVERDELIDEYAQVSFEQQKKLRLYKQFSEFVARHMSVVFEADPQLQLADNQIQLRQLDSELQQLSQQQVQLADALKGHKKAMRLLAQIKPIIHLLNDESVSVRLAQAIAQRELLNQASTFLQQYRDTLDKLELKVEFLKQDPANIELLQAQADEAEQQLSSIKHQCYVLEQVKERLPHFAYSDAQALLNQTSRINDELKAKLKQAEEQKQLCIGKEKATRENLTQANQARVALDSSLKVKTQTAQEFDSELCELGVTLVEDSEAKARTHKDEVQQQLVTARNKKNSSQAHLEVTKKEISSLGGAIKVVSKAYGKARSLLVNHKSGWSQVKRIADEHDVTRRLDKGELRFLEADELRSMSDKSLGTLRLAVSHDEELRDALRYSEDNSKPERKVLFYISVYQHLKQRIRREIIRSDDPVEAIEEMEIELARLAEELTQRESHLSISAHEVASKINNTIRREQNRIRVLNQGLQSISFGQVHGVRLNVSVREAYAKLLSVLGEQGGQHQDLFGDNELSFSQAMAKLFQRLNPHIDQGERSHQVLGEALLDYRNYLEMQIEVNRGADGWLRAESGALSTGEAIGTGQAILLMVLHSWEEESRRYRAKDILPCRLLFLDEAARLDGRSILTLFELCERQNMQLIIAAPENISPEKGTTYKLIRKIHGNHEHVHVIGLRGFGFGKEEVQLTA